MQQISMFDGSEPLKINKKIRLIELFAGYGSQSLAIDYLGVPHESWRISEWAIPSIKAYKDLHHGDDNTDYSALVDDDYIAQWLNGRISSNYNDPLTTEQIKRLGEKKRREIYNAMMASHNLGSIVAIKGKDLVIEETDKYTYLLTYSFPCQDLSNAGKRQGMTKGSKTRSGLLWEVDRLLDETTNLPQILLMENVPAVIGDKNINDFAAWIEKLDSLGYKSKWQVLNATGFGVPQNRERCYMVSWLDDYYFDFPTPWKLERRLRDLLEDDVDERYYLSDEAINALEAHKQRHEEAGHGFGWKPNNGDGVGSTVKTESGYRPQTNFYAEPIGLYTGTSPSFTGKQKVGVSQTIQAVNAHASVAEPIIYDDFNGQIKADQSCIGTLTTNCGNDAPRNGTKIMLPIECKVLFELDGGKWDNELDMHKRVFDIDVLSPTVTTFGGGNTEKKVAISIKQLYEQAKALYPNRGILEHNGILYWVRKLTERECWRLMGVKDEDFDKVNGRQSRSSMYHLAGDSIVTTVEMALFGELFGVDWQSKVKSLAEEIAE